MDIVANIEEYVACCDDEKQVAMLWSSFQDLVAKRYPRVTQPPHLYAIYAGDKLITRSWCRWDQLAEAITAYNRSHKTAHDVNELRIVCEESVVQRPSNKK